MNSLDTKVTFIKNKYHIRLIKNNYLISEIACKLKTDINWCCNHLLKWYDKMGGVSKMAMSSRNRNKDRQNPGGKVWYGKDLHSKYIGTYLG